MNQQSIPSKNSTDSGAVFGRRLLCLIVFGCIIWKAGTSFAALKADINSDGVVNFYDFVVLANEWLKESIETVPNPRYEIAFPSLSLVRNSTAYDCDFRQLPQNVGRYKDICIASRPAVWINTNVARLVHDIDGDLIICSDYEPVYTTTDGVTFTELLNITTDQDFVGYYDINDHVRSVKVMPDGSWLLSIGRMNLGGSGSRRGDLFRSVDKGLAWTHVLEYESGYTPYWGWWAVSDNEVAIGEYGYIYQSNNPRRIYYSDDYGVTWSKIWEPAPEWGQHCHFVAFKPGDTNVIYASYDGSPNDKVVKLQYTPGPGGKRNIANWSEAANSPILEHGSNPVCALSDGRYLYLGHDSWYYPVLWRLDPNDDSVASVMDWQRYFNDPNHPYLMAAGAGAQIFGMVIHEGVYYAAVKDVADHTGGGVYVSTDGKHWTCAYRVEGVQGFHNIVGFANGYLWGTYYDTTRRLYKVSPVQAEVVKAMYVERGITNQFDTPESSSFEGGDGGWVIRSPSEDINVEMTGMSTEMALHGSSSYKIVSENKGNGVGGVYSGYCPVNPVVGDYICASFWIKAAPTWPNDYLCSAAIEAVGGQIDSLTGWFKIRPNQDWQRAILWGKCTDDNFTNGVRIKLKLHDSGYPGDFSDATCFVDCVQVVYFSDLHYSGSWQIGGAPRTDEVAAGSLVGLGAEFTTTFEWRPGRSRREWHGNVYIASWTDGQEHIDLYYDHGSSRFVATDGTNTAVATEVFSWDHFDSIKFALANMDGDFRLSVLTPLNGVEHISTDNVDTRLGSPVAITFGTDSWGTNYGCGLIANIKYFDSALTISEIQQVFDLVKTAGM